jgi:hypothetical protein
MGPRRSLPSPCVTPRILVAQITRTIRQTIRCIVSARLRSPVPRSLWSTSTQFAYGDSWPTLSTFSKLVESCPEARSAAVVRAHERDPFGARPLKGQ